MFSICIPVYRYDVRPLVRELLRQAEELTDPEEERMEILVYDDASPDDGDWGKTELRVESGIVYRELPQNIGRAAIRNKLAREAQHDYLIMLDADGEVHPDYVNDYFVALEDVYRCDYAVVVGGREYAAQMPPATHRLHWRYGREREALSVTERARNPYLGFQSNNFLVRRAVLLDHPFPEEVRGYGHEDTLWGQQLAARGYTIDHIHNPLIHRGLESNAVFLGKQRRAVHNLRTLKSEHPHLRTRLTDHLERYPKLNRVLGRTLPGKALESYLLNQSEPSLYALDLLKIKWWYE